jgi:hypothetical protein
MKKLFGLTLILLTIGMVTSNLIAAPYTVTHINMPDSLHQKIKRPTTAMTDEQLNSIYNLMRQKNSDQEKVAVLKAGVKDNGITVDQLTKLLNQLLADSAKLDCAEYAYPYTVNYKAFLSIEDLFAQEPNKWALESFVKKYK